MFLNGLFHKEVGPLINEINNECSSVITETKANCKTYILIYVLYVYHCSLMSDHIYLIYYIGYNIGFRDGDNRAIWVQSYGKYIELYNYSYKCSVLAGVIEISPKKL